ncbi:hypothetical protein M378DRAFT_168023 [Amanita muscaria Koide BX008]|uniref:Uncharacterized protein n=1 Tax=Amanita muscaria (strain Koide BX008) TaxID=946122 RepID=A0A0C2WGI2_AMAMK|nr:hypothetical protein M378DRAFT_168023 [Amanita muscaria Koide BX008]
MSEVIGDIVRRFQEELGDEHYERAHAEREAALELAKPQEDQHLEKRFFQAIAMGIEKIIHLVSWIKEKIAADKAGESNFTQTLIQKMFKENRCLNYVICHKCTSNLKDQKHRHEEFKLSFFKKTKGYDIHWGGEGTVQNIGDGGYLNWAWVGHPKSTHTNFVEFKAPTC